MPEDLAVLQFLEVFPVFFRWEEFFDDSWGLPSAAVVLLGARLQFFLAGASLGIVIYLIWAGV